MPSDKWSAKGYLWKGTKSFFPKRFETVLELIKDEPLIVMFENDETYVTNVFGEKLGYLTPPSSNKCLTKHKEGYLLLAKVDQPMTKKPNGKLCRLGVYVWAEQDRLDSDNKELVDADLETV